MKNSVVTITLNPALDLTGSLPLLNLGKVSLVSESAFHAAGKGVNVAQVLSDLGANVTVTGFLGADNQEPFCQLFKKMGAVDKFLRVPGATRINVKLVESSGRVNDINFPGVHVSEQHIEAMEKTLLELCESHDYFVLAGSLPQGVSPTQCAQWIRMLRKRGKIVYFDSSHEALKLGIDAKPSFIKPNEDELAALFDQDLDNPSQCLNAIDLLSSKGVQDVVVSLGDKGVIWKRGAQTYSATPPRMDVVSTVGAGDTFVAGFCFADMQGFEPIKRIAFATALSALAVTQVGVGVNNLQSLKDIQQKVCVKLKD